MNKVSILLIGCIFFLGCQPNKKTETTQTTTDKVENLNIEPPKPIANLQVESYPTTTIDESLLSNESTDAKWTVIEGIRVGKITKNSSLEELKRLYTSAEYDVDTIRGKSKTLIAVTFYKNGPDQFQVFWDVNNNYKNPLMVKLFNTNSKWVTSNGIRVGSSLETVIAANGKDFYFIGFDNTVGEGKTNGKVRSWNNGNLSNNLGIAFRYSSKADAFESFKQFEQLRMFPTNHPDVKDLGMTVREISCTFR